ncbi:MAG TPA: hypothetical protein VEW48_00015 [Thermoanaerobaculia bacterium]|nr:hypothetical protein [Thermoanaerobaculia bacterium]
MKKGGCALFGCAVVVGLLALATLAAVRLLAADTSETGPVPVREASPRPEPVPGDPDLLRLTFRFRDPDEQPRQLSCVIRRSDYEREEAGFGFVRKQMVEELNRALRGLLEREAEARGVASYFKIEVFGDGSFRWTYKYPDGTQQRVVQRIKDFHAWLNQDAAKALQPLTERYYRDHGLRLAGDDLSVDYETLARNASTPLADCFQALKSLGGGRLPLSLFLTFIQDLRYELPPDVDPDGRETLGFRVPTAVMVKEAGDCDSKAAAFCSLWRQIPARVLLILVPGHALVAVEGKPGPDQASIRLGNRYFILCEVAGPGRSRPGETQISGSFQYVLIEPA